MKRLLFMVAFAAAFVCTMNAQNNYSRLWSKVKAAEKEGKPQTAAGYLRELEEKTVKAGDELEQLVVSEELYENLRKYNWKEANAYFPSYSALTRRVLEDSLEQNIVKYKDHPRVMRLLYKRLRNHKEALDRRWKPSATGEEYLALREECRTLLKHKYVGTFKESIQAMIDGMESRDLSSGHHSTMAPARDVEYYIDTRNVDRVEVKVYKLLDNKLFFEGFADVSETLLRKNGTLVSSQEITGFRNEFNIGERKSVKVDFPEPGVYVVYFSAGGKDICYDAVNVSRVGGALRIRNGKGEVYAADLTTGKPFGEGRFSLYRNLGENGKSGILNLCPRKRGEFSGEGFTGVDTGEALSDTEHSWVMRIENGSDIYAPAIGIGKWYGRYDSYEVPEKEYLFENTRLFTDRTLYKPGDTIHFKVIFFKAGETVGEVLAGKEVEIKLRHVSEDEPAAKVKLVTNEFGSAAGTFTLPEGSKNGVYVFESGYSRIGRVRVEEYKRPTFTVSLEPVTEALAYGDVIRQTGRMRSYAGFSVAGGEVWYTVSRTTHSRTHGRYLGSEKLMEGMAISDGEGRFELVFPAERPYYKDYEEDDLQSDYRITVTAVDPQGEAHETGISVPVSDIPVDLSVVLPENEHFGNRLIVDKDRTKAVTVEGTTLNGTPYPSSGTWRVMTPDSTEVRSGSFETNTALPFDFTSLPSGDYRLEASLDFRGRKVTTGRDVVVMSTDDRHLPFKSEYFYYPVETEGAIEFVIGTTEDDLWLEIELFDNDEQLYREGVHLRNEMRKFRLPYKPEYRSEVKLSVFGFRNGHDLDYTYSFTRPGDVLLDVGIETLRDKTTPNTVETMTVRAPAGSELVVSIYDSTTDRLGANSFNFHPLREHVSVGRPSIRTSLDGSGVYGLRFSRNAAFQGAVDEMVLMEAPMAKNAAGASFQDASFDTAAGEEAEEAGEETPDFEARSNFSELVGFFPQVRTDDSGLTQISYRTSDLMSTFRVLVAAHDKKLHTGNAEGSFVVQQELIVQPNVPLFVTQGDRIVLKAKLVNLGQRLLAGTAYCEIRDAEGRKLRLKGLDSQKRSLLAGAQDEVKWTVEIPGGTDRLTAKIWFATPEVSDGEQHEMQVAPCSITLTEAASFVIGQGRDHKYYEKQLRKQFGAADPKIEYAEYSTLDAVKESLPKAAAPESNNAIAWINQLYINQMRCKVLGGDPEEYQSFRDQAFSRLKTLQSSDGGIQWFAGMRSNTVLTLYLLEKLGQLRSVGALEPSEDEMALVRRAVRYVDSRLYASSSYKNFNAFGYIRDFAIRSLWFDIPLEKGARTVYNRFIDKTAEGWQDISILEKAQMANMMLRAKGTEYDDKSFAGRIKLLRESLKDYAVENATVGCYFPNAVMPFRGLMNNEIYAHSQLIETFGKLGEKKVVDGIAQWLLLQKHNQAWENTVATTDAVHALISSGAKDLRLGAVYYTYTTTLDRVKASANEISVQRTFKKAGGGILNDGDALHVGDEIIVRYSIHNTENRSFVQMKAMRPACFYPADERSYFTWYGFYREVKPSLTNYYWELLPEEYTTVEERFFVQQEGRFNSGLVQIECLYASEYRGHTDAVEIISK
ncbi:MAG: hypothetical protein K6G79_09920 [Bacteroidales bacterium]|nr:hypothetical protein [Bacteroidales bacterium]